MNAITQTLDTLGFANRLKTAGLDPKVAEAQAELQAEVFDELIKNQEELEQNLSTKMDSFATKADLNATKMELKNRTSIK